MIGYNRLGDNGRFGNQLFQYAALRGVAARITMSGVYLHLSHIEQQTMDYLIALS